MNAKQKDLIAKGLTDFGKLAVAAFFFSEVFRGATFNLALAFYGLAFFVLTHLLALVLLREKEEMTP